MSTEPVTEQQHYVPQFYLRHFADPSTGEVQILDLELGKILRPRGPRGLCQESFFYGIDTGKADETSQTVEHYFGDLETALAHDLPPVIAKLRDSNEHIYPEEKMVIAILMSMIWLRGPGTRDRINDMQEQVLNHEGRFIADHPRFNSYLDGVARETGGSPLSDEMRENVRQGLLRGEDRLTFNNWAHLQFLSDRIKPFARLFCAQHWNVGISRDAGTFATSCDPVVKIVPPYDGFYPPTFLQHAHYFSLTPDICIEAVDPPRHKGKRVRRKTLFAAHEGAVHQTNLTIASRSRRYVYARDREPLEVLLRALPGATATP